MLYSFEVFQTLGFLLILAISVGELRCPDQVLPRGHQMVIPGGLEDQVVDIERQHNRVSLDTL